MLHMIVATHGPDTCPGSHPEIMDKVQDTVNRMDEVGGKYGATTQGAWVNPPGHVSFVLVDAPNAHELSAMVMELGLPEWNTVTIHPVMTLQEAMAMAQERS